MSIYLDLFLTFFKIGAVSFGGGYGMLALIREEVLSHGWLTEEMFLNYLAVSESTPGPIAINMATFIGSNEAGILGSLVATVGVVLPAFLIMFVIVAFIRSFLKYKGARMVVDGIKPVVSALIITTGITMMLGVVLSFSDYTSQISFDWKSLVIIGLLAVVSTILYVKKKKTLSPILTVIVSAVLGMVLYGIF